MSPNFCQLSPVVVRPMRLAIRMEMFPVAEFTANSKETTSVSADLTFTAAAVNHDIRELVLDTINGAPEYGGLKGRLRAASIALGLPFGRVRRYHYGEVRRIEAHEAFQIIKRAEIAKRQEFERARHKYEALRLQLANSAPSRLEFLVPPTVAPIPDLEGVEEVDPSGNDY
jgi:hypothetical protein